MFGSPVTRRCVLPLPSVALPLMAGFIASPAAAAGFRTSRVWDSGVLQGNTSRQVVFGVGGIFTKRVTKPVNPVGR